MLSQSARVDHAHVDDTRQHLAEVHHAIPRIMNNFTDYFNGSPESVLEGVGIISGTELIEPLLLLFICEEAFRNLAFLNTNEDDLNKGGSNANVIDIYLNIVDDFDHIITFLKGILDGHRAHTTIDTNTKVNDDAIGLTKLHKRTATILEDLCIMVGVYMATISLDPIIMTRFSTLLFISSTSTIFDFHSFTSRMPYSSFFFLFFFLSVDDRLV
jgi:hypothetical protein